MVRASCQRDRTYREGGIPDQDGRNYFGWLIENWSFHAHKTPHLMSLHWYHWQGDFETGHRVTLASEIIEFPVLLSSFHVSTCQSWPQASTLKNLLGLPAEPSSWPVSWRTSQWALVKPALDVFSTDRIPQRKPAALSARPFPLNKVSNYRRLPLWEHGIVGDVCVKKASMFGRHILCGHPNGWLPPQPIGCALCLQSLTRWNRNLWVCSQGIGSVNMTLRSELFAQPGMSTVVSSCP